MLVPSILEVALPVPLRKTFDYRVPEGFDGRILPGVRVWVPFGSRKRVGVVVAVKSESELPLEKLKTMISCIDAAPLWGASLWQLLLWAADYYRHPLGEVLFSAMPKPLREGEAVQSHESNWAVWTEKAQAHWKEKEKKISSRLRNVLERLSRGPCHRAELSMAGFQSRSLEAYTREGYILWCTREENDQRPLTTQDVPLLNADQAAAVQRVMDSADHFQCFLLYGITGSGKTEVYLRLIEQFLKRDRQILVLVPEIALTPQLFERFVARFGSDVLMWHSHLSDRVRFQVWCAMQSGEGKILIGTRSSFFCDLPHLGLIIVDEEHDRSLKQMEGFAYSARDLSIFRGQKENIPVVLGSATPSLESWAQMRRDRYILLPLHARAVPGAKPPRAHLVDLRADSPQEGLSSRVVDVMRDRLDRGQQIMVFLNRRGFSPSFFCPRCRWQAACASCSAYFFLHDAPRRLLCHHCGAQQPVPRQCPSCQEGRPVPMGVGTERMEKRLESLFGAHGVVRMDADSTRRSGSLALLLERIQRNEARVILGTQMLAKGHDFPNVGLVVVVDADSGLFSSDFRGSERLLQLLSQVMGRSGRGAIEGEVYLQTYFPDHALLSEVMAQDYAMSADRLLEERRLAQVPPYGALTLLRMEAQKAGRLEHLMPSLLKALEEKKDGRIRILGPLPAPLHKRAGWFRYQCWLISDRRDRMRHYLERLPALLDRMLPPPVRWHLDVDAQDVG